MIWFLRNLFNFYSIPVHSSLYPFSKAIISNEINGVMSDHTKHHKGLAQFIQLQTRTWNINV